MRHLKAIRAIHEAGSLTKAATALGLAQPALSAQLKRIERTLGGPLFERGRQGVRATALGELVLQRARVVLPAVHGLQQEAAQFARCAGDGWSALRIGGGYGEPLGGLVDRLAALHPGARISTHTSWSEEELAASVAEGRLDFALIGTCGSATPPAADRLNWQPVAADPVRLLVAAGGPLDRPGPVGLAELDGWAWTAVPGDGCLADCFAAACARAGCVSGPLYETDAASCVHLARVGRAVALCRATFPGAAGVAVRDLAGTPLTWRHLLGHRPAGATAGIAPVVLEQARAAYTEALDAVRPGTPALS
ncbi:LysR family transcriptional regulator [Streptomyces sp. A7024]|uniref:LysR family transcriptional regulator n=1 Tax=Streptomyces coryli TaxID=1128680 RepID=A0A6G4TUG9_9ACTN|nr:LysR family transcriptional regulator [Streptomyces coryli]